jgi:hypothetical protein
LSLSCARSSTGLNGRKSTSLQFRPGKSCARPMPVRRSTPERDACDNLLEQFRPDRGKGTTVCGDE